MENGDTGIKGVLHTRPQTRTMCTRNVYRKMYTLEKMKQKRRNENIHTRIIEDEGTKREKIKKNKQKNNLERLNEQHDSFQQVVLV